MMKNKLTPSEWLAKAKTARTVYATTSLYWLVSIPRKYYKGPTLGSISHTGLSYRALYYTPSGNSQSCRKEFSTKIEATRWIREMSLIDGWLAYYYQKIYSPLELLADCN